MNFPFKDAYPLICFIVTFIFFITIVWAGEAAIVTGSRQKYLINVEQTSHKHFTQLSFLSQHVKLT